ncbi:hypothetical protein CHS0354_008316 [Potamilus streckersoni]|uniref:Cystatin domain-containing protein n=1 Tax=Potamilus streckersoni TaxID=2493646 RepID=A0AAE0SCB2_9BIVA|nr:hypothetical protein CHS0354_008316 [Potamilus streckersoni]
MRKYMVIIAIAGICLVFSVAGSEENTDSGEDKESGYGGYQRVSVNSTKVQAVANIILEQVKADPACQDFTLLDVKTAERKNGVIGVDYKLKLRFRNGNDEIKKCKHTIAVSEEDLDSASTAARQTNDNHKRMRRTKPSPAPYIKWCTCANLNKIQLQKVIDKEEEC